MIVTKDINNILVYRGHLEFNLSWWLTKVSNSLNMSYTILIVSECRMQHRC